MSVVRVLHYFAMQISVDMEEILIHIDIYLLAIVVVDVDPVVEQVPVQLSNVQLPHPDLLTLQIRLTNVRFV